MTNYLCTISAYNGVLKGEVPVWAVRPGALRELKPVADSMGLWLAILSINGVEMKPCIASEETLAQLLGVTRNTIRARLARLRMIPGLLLEVERGREWKTGRTRPYARWATDPTRIEEIKKLLAGRRLAEVAMEAGLGAQWRSDAGRALDEHETAAKALRLRMAEAIPGLCAKSAHYAGSGGGEAMGREKARRGREGSEGERKKRRAPTNGTNGKEEIRMKKRADRRQVMSGGLVQLARADGNLLGRSCPSTNLMLFRVLEKST
jgi:hypothetical protein